jgi:hypothetical protein
MKVIYKHPEIHREQQRTDTDLHDKVENNSDIWTAILMVIAQLGVAILLYYALYSDSIKK